MPVFNMLSLGLVCEHCGFPCTATKMETTDEEVSRKSKRNAKKCAEIGRILVKEEVKARVKQVCSMKRAPKSTRKRN